jgi:hypothetical protein
LHNSNKSLVQITLIDEELLEEKYFLLGFLRGKNLKLNRSVWFVILDNEQIDLVNVSLEKKSRAGKNDLWVVSFWCINFFKQSMLRLFCLWLII